MTTRKQESDQEEVRSKLLQAEVASLGVFAAVKLALPKTVSFHEAHVLAGRIREQVSTAVYQTRSMARAIGRLTLETQFERSFLAPSALVYQLDATVAHRIGVKVSLDWVRKLNPVNDTFSPPKLAGRLDTIAITESASTFNAERRRVVVEQIAPYAQIDEFWDPELDKRTCPVCFSLDGAKAINGSFPGGQRPGSAHPRCRCVSRYEPISTFNLLPYVAAGATYGWLK